jgi:hypothetical protein
MKKNILGLIGCFAAVMVIVAVALAYTAGTPGAAHSVAQGLSHGLSLLFMGVTAVTYTTVSNLQKGYKRATTKLYRTHARNVPEYRWLDQIDDEEIMPSGRENNILLDVAVGVGAHQVTDAGYESRTETPELEEGSFVYNHTNSRFSISLRAQAFDRKARAGQIIRQIKYQSLKCIEAVMRKYGFMFYGTTSGVLAEVDGNPASGTTATVTLRDAFGQSSLDNAAYLASMFPIDEGVAFIRSNALVGFGVITDFDATAGTIDVDFDGTIDLADGDQIVYGNGVTGGTITESDFNKWNAGLLDFLATDTVHGVSTASVPTWAPAVYDTNGGSFDFIKLRKIRQQLANKGDTTLRRLILANGVQNEKDYTERQALIWTDSGNMNLDGNAKAKGATEDTSRFTPPTCAFGIGADAMGKSILSERPDEDGTIEFGRLHKAEDRSALKGGVDTISATICRSRSRIAGYVGLTERGT